MANSAIVINDVAVNVCDPATVDISFHPDFWAAFISVPDEVEVGWVYDGMDWNAPPDPPAPPFDIFVAKANRKITIEQSRAARANVGLIINGLPGDTDPEKMKRFDAAALALLADDTKTSASWDRVNGVFETFDRDIFLFAYILQKNDIDAVNERAGILYGEVDDIDNDLSEEDSMAALAAVDAEWSEGDYNGWPARVDVSYP